MRNTDALISLLADTIVVDLGPGVLEIGRLVLLDHQGSHSSRDTCPWVAVEVVDPIIFCDIQGDDVGGALFGVVAAVDGHRDDGVFAVGLADDGCREVGDLLQFDLEVVVGGRIGEGGGNGIGRFQRSFEAQDSG